MFGAGRSVQHATKQMIDYVLLLEIESADMMWGDSGAMQIWIKPGDLAKGRFDKAIATVEGH